MKIKWVLILFCLLGLSIQASAGASTDVLKEMTSSQGFFFFYSSTCPHCHRFAPVLERFSHRFGFSVVAISVDGGILPSFPNSVVDEGQKNIFKVNILPSLFLVNPKTKLAVLVTEGFIDEAELAKRVLKIANTNLSESTP